MPHQVIGAIFLGMTIGKLVPALPLPAPFDIINSYLWVIFLVLGIVFFIKG